MNQALEKHSSNTNQLSNIENVLVNGDLSKLTTEERLVYYNKVCESLGLNPLTKPFDYIPLNGRLTLYARKDATEQLRKRYDISIIKLTREVIEGVCIVTASAKMPDGREDESTGAVAIGHLKGEALANAMMKAETKAKRRVTLSICGLGMLDETEVESIPEETASHVQASGIKGVVTDGRKPSEAQLKRLFAISRKHNVSNDQVKAFIHNRFGVQGSKDLTISQYNELCDSLEQGLFNTPPEQAEMGQIVGWEEEIVDPGFPPIPPMPEAEEPKGQLPWKKYLNENDPKSVK